MQISRHALTHVPLCRSANSASPIQTTASGYVTLYLQIQATYRSDEWHVKDGAQDWYPPAKKRLHLT